MIDALKSILASNLRLSSAELAAIGGFYDCFAYDLLNGKWPVARDIYDHVLDTQEDLNGITDTIGGWYRRRCSLTICILGERRVTRPLSPAARAGQRSVDLSNRIGSQDWPQLMR